MVRTDPSAVKNTFDTSLSDSAVSDWISRASKHVDRVEDADPSIPGEDLEDLEVLAAQHLCALQDPRHESVSGASRKVSHQGETGMYWEATFYGQQAVALDPTGVLKESPDSSSFESYTVTPDS